MALKSGDLLGNYRVIELLGSGGMGHVYKVQNTLSNRIEAMKVLLSELSASPELASRFLREIQVQAALVHPNIVSLHTALQIGEQVVMIMEYVEGDTLEARLRRGPIPVGHCLPYANQILHALAYAHGQGVIHRDIKPANIILSPNGMAKMMDFGLAAVNRPGGVDQRLTRTGTVMGSLSYMSPEQVRGLSPTVQSDVYSFGLTLYEMLTGVRGINGESDYSVMTAHLDTMPPAPALLNPSIPPELSDLVLRAIAKNPQARFPSASDFAAALFAYAKRPSGPAQTVPARPLPPAPPPPPTAARRERWLGVWMAIVGAIVAVTLAAVFWPTGSTRRTEPKPEPPIEVATAAPKSAPADIAPPTAQPKPDPQAAKPKAAATVAKSVEPPKPRIPDPKPVVTSAAPQPVAAPKPVEIAKPPVPDPSPPVTAPPPVATPTPTPVAVTPPVATPAPAPVATPAATNPAPAPAFDAAAARASLGGVVERLQAAYASRDMNQVRAVFPNIGPDHAQRLDQFFKSARTAALRLELAGEPRGTADRIVAEYRHSLTARFRDGTEQKAVESRATIRIVRQRGQWVIDAIDFTQRGKSLYRPL